MDRFVVVVALRFGLRSDLVAVDLLRGDTDPTELPRLRGLARGVASLAVAVDEVDWRRCLLALRVRVRVRGDSATGRGMAADLGDGDWVPDQPDTLSTSS